MAIIRRNDRVFIAGKSGSGKTYLAERLIDKFPYVVILDNKGLYGSDERTGEFYLEGQGYGLCYDLDDIQDISRDYNKIVYRPAPELEADTKLFRDTMDSFFWWIYNRKNCVLYIDEATAVCDSYNILPGHNAIIKRGRQRGIGCWHSSQQPVNIHNTLLSESEHFFIFELRLQSHRDKIAAFMGDEISKNIPKDHRYYYYNVRNMDAPILMSPYSE